MSTGTCTASLERIAGELGISYKTVQRHVKALVTDGYLEDLTPNLRNRPHQYRDTGKAGVKVTAEAFDNGYETLDVGDVEPQTASTRSESPSTKTLSPSGSVRESEYQVRESDEESIKETLKESIKEDSRSNDRGKKKKERDPLLDHPAIIEFRDETRIHVLINWRKEVAETVGDDPKEVERWRAVVHDWIGRGWNKQNVKGMLEVFRNPEHKMADAYRKADA